MVALGDRQRDPMLPGFVAILIERSLVAMLLSLLPALLIGLDLDPRLLWALCSGTLAAYVLSLAIRSASLRRREPSLAGLISGPLFLILFAFGLGQVVIQILIATGLLLTQNVWWYLLGLTWLLASVCYHFFIFVRSWSRSG